ncbi:MAG: DUF998 domain-containing protein [Nitriliruptor sp.]|nr:MAG: DUF998 domain-containing protein [Nitriliruptor sp.]
MHLTDDSFPRPTDLRTSGPGTDATVLYARSYLIHRAAVGVLGVLLPLVLIASEQWLTGDVALRGSLSAYYHTAARDVFVATLAVVGVLLITYMSAQTWTKDFWLSLVGGIAVLLVAFFPTRRPGLSDSDPLCGATPAPAGCTGLQQALGETTVAVVHFTAAIVFVLSLAALCFVFARREQRHDDHLGLARFLRACGWVMIAAMAWIAAGSAVDLSIGPVTSLYGGEVLAFLAFGTAWLTKGRHLFSRLSA